MFKSADMFCKHVVADGCDWWSFDDKVARIGLFLSHSSAEAIDRADLHQNHSNRIPNGLCERIKSPTRGL